MTYTREVLQRAIHRGQSKAIQIELALKLANHHHKDWLQLERILEPFRFAVNVTCDAAHLIGDHMAEEAIDEQRCQSALAHEQALNEDWGGEELGACLQIDCLSAFENQFAAMGDGEHLPGSRGTA